MKIDRKTWDEYITRLSRINKRAANEMQAFLEKLATEGGNRREEQIIERAFGLATKYGEASGAAACDFYDKIAAGTGHNVPPANPADTATFAETVKAIRGTIKNQSEAQVPSTVGRLVKQCSADTMLQNAARDGAEFAWIPSGDTCAFCLTLASRGWQFISKKAVRNGHAEHIHANCNCEYCVRFSEYETVEGYDPEKYRKMYDNAEGSTPQGKINAMRRELYAQRKGNLTNVGVRGILKADARGMANGPRRAALTLITRQEEEHLLRCADDLAIPRDVLSFNTGGRTGFDDLSKKIHVRGDVFALPNAENINSILNERCALAHEYYGHYMHHPSEYEPNDWRDEYRASYRAAFDTPNLTDHERALLIIDAYDRAREAGEPLEYSEEARRILFGY